MSSVEKIFGKIDFVRSGRANRIRVRILISGLKVTLPPYSSEQEALDFIISKQKEILSKQEKLRSKETENPTILNENSNLKTLTFDVVLKRVSRKDIFFSMKDGLLSIEFPESTDCTKAQTQKHFWNGIEYFLRKEAKRLLPGRTKQLATNSVLSLRM